METVREIIRKNRALVVEALVSGAEDVSFIDKEMEDDLYLEVETYYKTMLTEYTKLRDVFGIDNYVKAKELAINIYDKFRRE